jgi:aryl-alcohol dehydrogenase-like predicted oxidoreductase
MKYRKLGLTGTDVSVVGLGTWSMGGDEWGESDDQASIAVITAAVRCGVTLMDTADVYGLGHSEELLGEAVPADADVLIITKGGWDIYTDPPVVGGASRRYDAGYLEHAVAQSQKRLRRSCLDIYLLHNPTRADFEEHRPVTTLRALQDRGAVGLVGASVGAEDDARAAIAAGIDVIEMPFNLVRNWASSVLPQAAAAGVAVLTREPLERGLLTGKYGPDALFPDGDHRGAKGADWLHAAQPHAARVAEVARARGCEPAQVAIAYPLSYPNVSSVLLGARTVRQLSTNVAAAEIDLTEQERSDLTQLEKQNRSEGSGS